jgi:hypothetical protein
MRTFAQQHPQSMQREAGGLARSIAQPGRSHTMSSERHSGRAVENQSAESVPKAEPDPLRTELDTNGASRFGHDLSGVPAESGARLTLSRPGDYFEREADRAADAVMRAPSAAQVSANDSGPGLHAPSNTEPSEVSPRAEFEVRRAEGGGAPLSKSLRDCFEPRFRQDFGSVRVHTGRAAESTSQSLRAVAFTYGPNIFFNAGQYRPDTRAGLGLLAHELAHVSQHQAGRVSRRVIQRATIPYGTISWADFQNATRPPEAGPAGSNVGAVIQTKFDLIPSYSGTSSATPLHKKCDRGRDVEVEALIVPEAVDFTKPEAVMIQENSWAQPRFTTPVADYYRGKARSCATDEPRERARLLKHEQGHFDITNKMAQNMRASQKLKADGLLVKEIRCGDQAARDAAWATYRSNVQPVLRDLANEWLRLRIQAQDDYDTQTNRGGIQAKQTAWETDISNGLPGYYPQTAPRPAPPAAAQPAQPQAPTPPGANNPVNPRRTQQAPPAK